ncbi:hypothetical protein MANES_01G168400v8 [Manihot esculenta]|uniref:Uncharacterized protein n=1 Tax=Manihot esculenta TaxID=3983 RepID=A0A2C9WLJ9_MANES|nr:hypothetical protein MANES_01G168400v8 [Manihot esculenta]
MSCGRICSCIPGLKRKESKSEDSDKSSRRKSRAKDERKGDTSAGIPGDHSTEGSSHQGTTTASSNDAIGAAAVAVHVSAMESSGGDG